MVILYISKGIYQVQPGDMTDTLAGGTSNGDLIWYSGRSFKGILHHANTANQTYTMPNASGHVALLENPQTWSSIQTYNAGALKVNNILFTTVGPQINGGTTLLFFNSSSNFIKSTIGNLDMITLGGSSSQRNIFLNIDAANDINPRIAFQSQAVDWITFDPVNAQFIPINNILHLGNFGHKWIDVWATNGTIQTSFSKYKKDIVSLSPSGCIAICKKIDSIFFTWKDDETEKTNFGINADPLLEEMPCAVIGDNGVYDRSLIALLFGAVRYLADKVEKLENNS